MSDINERRKFQRIELDLAVIVHQASQQVHAEIIDISLKGLLLKRLDGAIANGSCLVSIQLDNEQAININSQLRHSTKDTAGVEFDQMDLEAMVELRRLLELNSGSDELIGRAFSALQMP